jgi:hypothetical protein
MRRNQLNSHSVLAFRIVSRPSFNRIVSHHSIKVPNVCIGNIFVNRRVMGETNNVKTD